MQSHSTRRGAALLSLYFLGYHILTCLSLISYREKASPSRDKTHAPDRQPHFSFSSMQTPSHSALPLRRRSEPGSIVYSSWLAILTYLTVRRAAASPQPSPRRSHLQTQLNLISSTVRRSCDHEHDTTTNERTIARPRAVPDRLPCPASIRLTLPKQVTESGVHRFRFRTIFWGRSGYLSYHC